MASSKFKAVVKNETNKGVRVSFCAAKARTTTSSVDWLSKART